jgi:hypothetical protein
MISIFMMDDLSKTSIDYLAYWKSWWPIIHQSKTRQKLTRFSAFFISSPFSLVKTQILNKHTADALVCLQMCQLLFDTTYFLFNGRLIMVSMLMMQLFSKTFIGYIVYCKIGSLSYVNQRLGKN